MTEQDFNERITKTKGLLKSYSFNLTRNSEDAEDLYHDTYLRAFVNKDKFNVATNFRAWMCTIMKNIFINSYRRANKKMEVFKNTIEGEPFYEATATDKMTNIAALDDIKKAIDSLRWDYKYCFMKYFEGYKYHEIATELNIPIGNIKTNIFQARKKLKAQLVR
jgi:RNA polymerase sigma-70 factor (ECF subfamily)